MLASLLVLAANPMWKTAPMPGPMPTPHTQERVAVNGVTLFVATYGAGEPLILLHGGAGNGDHFANQVTAFAAKSTVLVVDSRGHGRSTRTAEPLSYAQMADDVVALMDALKLPSASIVGWSDGGAIGLGLAIRYPTRVRKLVVVGQNATLAGGKSAGTTETFPAYFARCAADYARLSPTPKGFTSLQEALRPMWRTQPNFTDAQLRSITAPTLLLDGDHDEIVRADHLEHVAKVIPKARLVFIPDASHFVMFQQPQALNEAVLEFLAAP
ncbi:MAG: alpha/beta hydrolase [Myxococcales bacterium]|nr:alpha/beta hydrolase [Myxococcales bacterium]